LVALRDETLVLVVVIVLGLSTERSWHLSRSIAAAAGSASFGHRV
jgi:hypothetical protein